MSRNFALFISLFLYASTVIADDAPALSLRNKIGQMLIIGFEGKKVDIQSKIIKTIQKNNIGGVILFDYNSRTNSFDKNIDNPAQVKKLNEDLQHFNREGNKAFQRPDLPLLISIDYEGGKVNRLGEQYGFPQTISAAEVGTKSIKEADNLAQIMSQTLRDNGFNLNFAPVLDVKVNPLLLDFPSTNLTFNQIN